MLTVTNVYRPAQQAASIEVTMTGEGTDTEALDTALLATGETRDRLTGWHVQRPVLGDTTHVTLHRS